MDKKFKQNLIECVLSLQRLCEGYDDLEKSKKSLFTTQMRVLHYLNQGSCISPMLLCENVGIAKGNLTLLTNQMIAKNLIVKSKDELDKRIVLYCITEKGKNLYEKTTEQMSTNFQKVLAYKKNLSEISILIEKLLNEIK